jgi:hypothetical protein
MKNRKSNNQSDSENVNNKTGAGKPISQQPSCDPSVLAERWWAGLSAGERGFAFVLADFISGVSGTKRVMVRNDGNWIHVGILDHATQELNWLVTVQNIVGAKQSSQPELDAAYPKDPGSKPKDKLVKAASAAGNWTLN